MERRSEPGPDDDAAFRGQLIALIPTLRAFTRSLCYDATLADDVAQEAVLKAWKSRRSFTTGTNFKAWMFMIARNHFLSEKRRSWRSSSLDPEIAEQTLVANEDASAAVELNDVRQALNALPLSQREALILVGVSGFTYDEAAVIIDIAVGTVKSRVSRARHTLSILLETGEFARDAMPAHRAMSDILQVADQLGATETRLGVVTTARP